MASKKKQEDRHLQILRQLVAEQHNKRCFDCGQRGPTYVNMTIGAFVCTSCSGLLRGINPPHRVKSISMASFTAPEIDFLQKHGNEVCRSIWLALWNSASPPEPETRDEQKLKDLISRKYERKMWYSSQPVVREPELQEPEAKPLKSLLGENAPQVVMSTQKEQKSQRAASITSLNKPAQSPALKNSDLLGDLGSDPFGASASISSTNQNSFGIYNHPSTTQDQFATNNSGSALSAPFDFFASNTSGQSQQTTGDFFSSQPMNLAAPASDKYAALSNTDLFKDNDSHAGFTGSSIFSSLPSENKGLGTQPNPFMSSTASAAGTIVGQQQLQQQLTKANPFLTQTQVSTQNPSVNFSANQIHENQVFQSQSQFQQQYQFLNQQNLNGFPNQTAGFGSQSANFGNQSASFGNQPAVYGSHSAALGSKPVTFGSQPATFGSQPAAFGSQPAAFGSQPAVFGSQPAAFASQPATFGNQSTAFGNQPAAYNQNIFKAQQKDLNVMSQLNAFGSSAMSSSTQPNTYSNSGSIIQPNDPFGQSSQFNTWNTNQNPGNQFKNTTNNLNQQSAFPGHSNNQGFQVNTTKAFQTNLNAQSSLFDSQFSQQQHSLNQNQIVNHQNQTPGNQSNFSSLSNAQQHQQFWPQPQPSSKSMNPFM